VIPEDWEAKSIHELASIKTGPFGTLLKASEYSARDGVPLISVGEIREGFVRITDNTPRVPEEVTKRLPQYVLHKGDVVFARKGGVERSALVRQPQEGWFLGSDGISIRPSQACHDEYLALQFRSARVQGWLLQNAIGTTMPSLNQEILRNVVIPLPPSKAEQEAIAEVLSDADALIESLERLVAKKRQLKQGAMQELLTGKQRLSGFSGEWDVKQVGEFSECTTGGTPSTGIPEYWGGAIRWMSSGELNLKVVAEVEGRITDAGLRNSSTKQIPASCVLIGLAGQGKTRGTAAMNLVPLCTNQSIAAILPNPTYVSEYLYYNLDSRYEELRELSAGDGGRGGLNLTIIRSLVVPFPDLPEQTAIANTLRDIDAEIAAQEARLAKTRQLKQGMMQELLTGRIRLV
jgi:type I restriction enzyme S subunit